MILVLGLYSLAASCRHLVSPQQLIYKALPAKDFIFEHYIPSDYQSLHHTGDTQEMTSE